MPVCSVRWDGTTRRARDRVSSAKTMLRTGPCFTQEHLPIPHQGLQNTSGAALVFRDRSIHLDMGLKNQRPVFHHSSFSIALPCDTQPYSRLTTYMLPICCSRSACTAPSNPYSSTQLFIVRVNRDFFLPGATMLVHRGKLDPDIALIGTRENSKTRL